MSTLHARRLAAISPIALALLAPSTAGAVSVAFDPGDPRDAGAPPALLVTGGARERADVAVREQGNAFTVRARRGSLRIGRRCRRIASQTARCTSSFFLVRLSFGRRDDRATVALGRSTRHGVTVDAGAGNDRISVTGRLRRGVDNHNFLGSLAVIEGGPGNDILTGSSSDDIILGGSDFPGRSGNDVERGGAGNDRFDDRDSAHRRGDHDTFDGGPGVDELNLGDRTDSMTIDLTRGTGGGRGEHDRYSRLENVTSGSGNDTLIGSRANNELNGGEGNDVLRGNAGNDRLFGFSGRDVYDGGAGQDVLNAIGTDASTLACGLGADVVEGPGVEDTLAADCESARDTAPFTTAGVHPRTLTADGRATFDVSCARSVEGSCDGTLQVGGASARYSVGSGTTGSVLVQLAPADAAAAASAGGLVAAIRLEATQLNSFAWTTTLHAV